MPSFIAATEPLPVAQTIERDVRGFFSFFSCTDKKRTRSPFPKENICAFLTEEKSTKRLIEAPASNSHSAAGKRIPTAQKVLQCSQRSHRPPLPVRRVTATGKSAPAGARLPDCTRCPFGVFRRGLRTPAVRKHVPGADGIHFRRALTVKPQACSSFDAFLSAKKSMRPLLSKGKRKSMLSHAFSFLFRHNVIRIRSPEIVRNKVRIRFRRNIEAASFGKPFPCSARHIVNRAFIRIHR